MSPHMSHINHQRIPEVEEVLALDILTLRGHTELAGDTFDPQVQRTVLTNSLKITEIISVRRDGVLVAYAMLRPQPEEGGCWFVTGFNSHPKHRNPSTFRELFAQIFFVTQRHSITSLRSNVYKTNRLSMAFHKRLGFSITRENAKGTEFYATVKELIISPSIAALRI